MKRQIDGTCTSALRLNKIKIRITWHICTAWVPVLCSCFVWKWLWMAGDKTDMSVVCFGRRFLLLLKVLLTHIDPDA